MSELAQYFHNANVLVKLYLFLTRRLTKFLANALDINNYTGHYHGFVYSPQARY